MMNWLDMEGKVDGIFAWMGKEKNLKCLR